MWQRKTQVTYSSQLNGSCDQIQIRFRIKESLYRKNQMKPWNKKMSTQKYEQRIRILLKDHIPYGVHIMIITCLKNLVGTMISTSQVWTRSQLYTWILDHHKSNITYFSFNTATHHWIKMVLKVFGPYSTVPVWVRQFIFLTFRHEKLALFLCDHTYIVTSLGVLLGELKSITQILHY